MPQPTCESEGDRRGRNGDLRGDRQGRARRGAGADLDPSEGALPRFRGVRAPHAREIPVVILERLDDDVRGVRAPHGARETPSPRFRLEAR